MSKRFMMSILVIATAALGMTFTAVPAGAQSIPASRDFTGIWLGGPSDISADVLPGQEIYLTPHGARRFRTIDLADAPQNFCKPYGPTRGMQSDDPKQIIQTPTVMAILFEQMTDYRLIYIDGRSHPKDIMDYPLWEGHSVGKWEGDTLVVDTTGIREGTWLDSGGFEHSDKMHMIERFQKTDANTFKWTVTVEDPVFFAKPFTYSRSIKRADPKEITELIPARCDENEKDSAHAIKGLEVGGQIRHKKLPNFPD